MLYLPVFDLHENKLGVETHCHKNGFSRKLVFTPRQRELGNGLLKKLGKNEQLCQKKLKLVTPACDYAVARATFKGVETIKNQKFGEG